MGSRSDRDRLAGGVRRPGGALPARARPDARRPASVAAAPRAAGPTPSWAPSALERPAQLGPAAEQGVAGFEIVRPSLASQRALRPAEQRRAARAARRTEATALSDSPLASGSGARLADMRQSETIPRSARRLASRPSGKGWRPLAITAAVVLLLVGVVGLATTPWQRGHPLALDSAANHLRVAQDQAWQFEHRFEAILASEAANPGSLPTVDGAISALGGLSTALTAWSPPPPVSTTVSLFNREVGDAHRMLELVYSADHSGSAPAYQLSNASAALSRAKAALLSALAQVAPSATPS